MESLQQTKSRHSQNSKCIVCCQKKKKIGLSCIWYNINLQTLQHKEGNCLMLTLSTGVCNKALVTACELPAL